MSYKVSRLSSNDEVSPGFQFLGGVCVGGARRVMITGDVFVLVYSLL